MSAPAVPAVGALADVCLGPLLDGPPLAGRVAAVTPQAVYALLEARRSPGTDPDDRCTVVALLGPGAVRVPGALTVASDWEQVARAAPPGGSIGVAGGLVVLPGVRLRPARWYDSRVSPAPVTGPPPTSAGLGLPPLPAGLAAPAAALATALAGDRPGAAVGRPRTPAHRDGRALAGAVRGLIGLGPGLTPAGDDLLAGALVALLAAGGDAAEIERLLLPLLPRTTVVSAALLRHACAGRAVPELARFVAGVARRGAEPRMVQDLVGVGSTSGTALAHGALAGLGAVDPASTATPGRARRPPAQEVA